MRIGLALSGGGYRATVFHLGVLARLAEQELLEDVRYISTVSGGSLCAGMVFALNGFHWPSGAEYQTRVLPKAFELLTTRDIQASLLRRVLGSFAGLFETRADDLSALIFEQWGVSIQLKELPESPRWFINATCYESGKNFRFERSLMGDYVFGYSHDTDRVRLSDAMAASAGFPGLIGALELDASRYSWFNFVHNEDELLAPDLIEDQEVQRKKTVQPLYPKAHLWDGGVYDNHGLEALHNFDTGWRKGMDFLIVSDAAGRSQPEAYRVGPHAVFRIMTGIMMDQIRSLRSRAVVAEMKVKKNGVFLQNGNSCREILVKAGRRDLIEQFCPACLSSEDADQAARFETVIRKLTGEEFMLLYRHGFEVADLSLFIRLEEKFGYIGYANARARM